jgi:hypothetical protein
MTTPREPDRDTHDREVDTEWGKGRRDSRYPNIVWLDPDEGETTVVLLGPKDAASMKRRWARGDRDTRGERCPCDRGARVQHLRPATGRPGKAFVVFLGRKHTDTARPAEQRQAMTPTKAPRPQKHA